MAERVRFRVNIVGADEDVPRLLLVYGRGCGGEVAWVSRPRDGLGALVHQVKGQPAMVWVSDPDQLPEGVGPGRASGPLRDGPRPPAWALGAVEAVALVKRLKAKPPPAGPATLRGAWRGELRCTDDRPTVHLARKVATYGVLHLDSDENGQWTALFERGERWFGGARQERSAPFDTLAEAIQRGMVQMTGLVSEACSFRDTRRRNTVDAGFAAAHPYRPPREPRDPTERYKPKAKYAVVESAAGWSVVNELGDVVAAFGAREKGKARAHASALSRGGVAPPASPPRAPKPASVGRSREVTAEAVVTAKGELAIQSGPHQGIVFKPYERGDVAGRRGERVQIRFHPDDQFAHVVSSPSGPSGDAVPRLQDVPTPEAPSCPTSVAKIASAAKKEADALEDLSGSLWGTTEGPELLRRAAKLIRHAESLVRSPLCQGAEQRAAWAELKRAAEAYTRARDAHLAGQAQDAVKALRQVAERASLAAAKAAKACGQGAAGSDKKRPAKAPAKAPAEAPPPEPKKVKKGKKAETDAETARKDAVLMGAFGDAIAAAVKQMQAGGGS